MPSRTSARTCSSRSCSGCAGRSNGSAARCASAQRLIGLERENGALTAVRYVRGGEERRLECASVILAVGHSARDTLRALSAEGVALEPKPFSMGVRIEQRQERIDLAQYGAERAPSVPPADYKLNVHLPDGSSAYTFCMCPGGYVVAAASQTGGVVTNGMSNAARENENANAALLVTLAPEDFPYPGAFGGMQWQEELERRAFAVGGSNYHAPAQTVADFLEKRPSERLGAVHPSYRPGVTLCDLHDVLPKRITDTLEQALPALEERLTGFCRAGRGSDRAGDAQLLARAHPARQDPAGVPARALSLRRGRGLRGRHHERRRRRNALRRGRDAQRQKEEDPK